MVDFVANVTLDSSGTAAVIAANTVTIENGVIVTIARFNSGERVRQRPELQPALRAVTAAPAARLPARVQLRSL